MTTEFHQPHPFPIDEPATGPIPVVPQQQSPAARSLTKPLIAVSAVLLLALGVVTAMWISANNQLSALQQSISATAAEDSQVPDLRAVADKHFTKAGVVSGDADSVSITITDYTAATAWPGLTSMLDELGFSPAVIDRIGNTRALDGTREAQGKNCNVTWTYHPDDGLQMVFEAVHGS